MESTKALLEALETPAAGPAGLGALGELQDALGGREESASKARLRELQEKKEERVFGSTTGPLMDALSGIETSGAGSKASPLETRKGTQVAASLSVLDQFTLRVHKKETTSDDLFVGLGKAPSAKSQRAGGKELSKKARKRKDKAKARGVAYSDRVAGGNGTAAAGRSRRGRRGAKGRYNMM